MNRYCELHTYYSPGCPKCEGRFIYDVVQRNSEALGDVADVPDHMATMTMVVLYADGFKESFADIRINDLSGRLPVMFDKGVLSFESMDENFYRVGVRGFEFQ